MKKLVLLNVALAGVLIGMLLAHALPPGTADAVTPGCQQWETRMIKEDVGPPGWEPFAYAGGMNHWRVYRRCVRTPADIAAEEARRAKRQAAAEEIRAIKPEIMARRVVLAGPVEAKLRLVGKLWKDRLIRLERNDGTTVSGKLLGTKDGQLVLQSPNGAPLIIPANEVKAIALE